MTKEEKQLLLKDLCARLLYGVKGRYCLYDSKGNLTDWGNEPEIVENIDFKECKIWTDDTVQGYHLDEFKPYLRPLLSMTEEEREEIEVFICNEWFINDDKATKVDSEGFIEFLSNYDCSGIYPEFCGEYVDWLLSHHFDYRGLIEKGLALEATEDMYRTE